MNTWSKILVYELKDVIQSKWILAYGAFFLVITDLLFRFGDGGGKVVLSMLNVVLVLIPMVSIVFGLMYLYNARSFIELLLSQPIKRSSLYLGLYAGLALPMMIVFIVGTGLPFIFHVETTAVNPGVLMSMLGAGALLTAIFTALAFLIALRFDDRVKGLAVALGLWLFFCVVYDGMVLVIANTFSEYPLEQPMIALAMISPVDMARVLLLLQMDISALMGYTGAVFESFFGTITGGVVSLSILLLWIIIPVWRGFSVFQGKDFS